MPTIKVAKNVDAVCRALVQQYNRLHEATVADDGYVHFDQSGVTSSNDWERPDSVLLQVDADDATDLATLKTLTANLIGVFNAHCRDAHAHRVADTDSLMDEDGYSGEPEDLDECVALLNALQHRHNAHCSRSISGTKCHANDDATNTSDSAEATDQSSAETMAIELKGDINAHIAEGCEVGRIELV